MAETTKSKRQNTTGSARIDAYDLICRAILSGEFLPGTPLREIALAEWAGVSRTPVREALRRLEQDGLVTATAQGVIVRDRSPEEVLDLYDVRINLESMAARVAAERRTDHDLRQMRWTADHGRQIDSSNIQDVVDINSKFHGAVHHASHNEALIDLLGRLELHVGRYPASTLSALGRWETACDEHELLIEAIANRDGERAAELAAAHFMAAREIRLTQFYDESSRM